jgi:hypothetical protein
MEVVNALSPESRAGRLFLEDTIPLF